MSWNQVSIRNLHRRALLASAGACLVAGRSPALAQQQPIANVVTPVHGENDHDTGWILAADRQRVELRASPLLASNVSFRRHGSPIAESETGYKLGLGTEPDYAFRLGMAFALDEVKARQLGTVAGVGFRTEPPLPALASPMLPGATGGHAGLFVLRAGGKSFGGVVFPTDQMDGWNTALLFDTRAALDAMELASQSGENAEVEATLLSTETRLEEFGVRFTLDLTAFSDANYVFNMELSRRTQAHVLRQPFTDEPPLR